MADQRLRTVITAKDATGGAFRSVSRGLSRIRDSVFSVQTALVGLAGTAGFGLLVKSTIETNREFQKLQTSLRTFTGSAENAAGAFEVLQDFASRTPFSLREVVGGFNKLIARGLNPTVRSLLAFGNISSGVGKSLDQLVEAAADAAVFEFERLKEFGIKAKNEGDKIIFTFKGVETEVDKSAQAINEYLMKLGEIEFGGAVENQSKTLNGAISNLGDSFDKFKVAIGEAGFNQALINASKFFTSVASGSNDTAKSIGRLLASGVNALPEVFIRLGQAAEFVYDNLVFLRRAFVVLTASVFAKAILGQAIAFLRFSAALLTAQKAMVIYRSAQRIMTLGTIATALVIAELTVGMDKLAEAIDNAFTRGVALADKAFPGLKDALDDLFPSVDADIKALEDLQKKNDLSASAVANLDAKLADFVPTITQAGKATNETKTAFDKFREAANDVNGSLERMAVDGLDQIADSFAGLVTGTTTAKDAFRNMANSILADLSRIAAKKALASIVGDTGGGIGSIIGGLFGKKAIGGSVQAGQPYMVGERGAEMFVPNQSGAIVPNNQLGGGAVTVNQTVNLTTGVAQTVRTEVMNMLPQIQQAAVSAVLDARRRGGAFGTAFGG